MNSWSKRMWATIFCLSALVCAREADALREDKVYRVLFVSYQSFHDPLLLPEVQRIRDALAATLPDNDSEIVLRTTKGVSGMTNSRLAEYSFVLWHDAGGTSSHADAPLAASKILAAGLPVMIFDDAKFPVSRLFGLVDEGEGVGNVVSGDGNKVEGDTEQNGLYHAVLRHLIKTEELNDYEPSFAQRQWGEDGTGKTLFWVHRSELGEYTRGLLQHYDANEGQNGTSYPQRVLALVNDKKRIVASGIRDTSGDPLQYKKR